MREEAGQLLDTGAGGADDPDSTPGHRVAESEADAVQDGRPAVGPHEEQLPPDRLLLEEDLVRDRDVVREAEDVQSLGERVG